MLTVTPLEPADRANWERLFRDYIAVSERDEPQGMYDRAWSALMRDERLHVLGARLDGALTGIAHFLVHPSASGPDVCYLEDLFTDAAARGKGVGRALIAAVGDWAKLQGCARLYWLTHETNTVARALYEKVAVNRGFIEYDVALTGELGASR